VKIIFFVIVKFNKEFFFNFKGIYQYDDKSDGSFFNVHSVKILGWGEENGIPYWLVANSFGSDWGYYGTFKISRGNDGCFFQEKMYAGLPL